MKSIFYERIKNFKPRSDLSILQVFKEYNIFLIISLVFKRNIRIIKFKNLIHSIGDCFLTNDAQCGWSRLKEISKPSYSPSQSSVYIKIKEGNVLVSQEDQLNCFSEHY